MLLGLLWRAMAATVEPEEPGLVPSVARSELRRGVPQVAAIEAALKADRPRVEPGAARAAARDIRARRRWRDPLGSDAGAGG